MLPLGDEGTPAQRGVPIVNLTIIGLCVLAFAAQYLFGIDQSIMAYGAIPYEITHGVDLVGNQGGLPQQAISFPVYVTLLTSMFMHANLVHIGGNMLFLFIFGDNVEDNMGHIKYALFYLICGFAASFAQIIMGGGDSPVPGVGASGAIAGVMAAYLILFPQAQIRTVIGYGFITRVPAIVMIGLWALIQIVSGVGSLGGSDVGGVAYWAHIGGFISGLILVFLLGNRQAGQGFSLGQFGR
jgi:membrane associated rhomboid family serine protease